MIFETDQEPISKPRRKLNWIDAILPTLLGVGGCVLLTYVLGQFFAEYVFMLVFNPEFASYPALVPLAVFLLLILAIASALSWKARGRETETSFYLPPTVLVCGLIFLTVYLYKPVPSQATPGEISAQELRKFKQKLSDPDFVMNLKGPLPTERTLALISEIDHADDLVLRHEGGGTSRFAIECGSGYTTVNCALQKDLARRSGLDRLPRRRSGASSCRNKSEYSRSRCQTPVDRPRS